MNNAVIAADIMAIMSDLIILSATLFVSKLKGKRKILLALLLVISIFMCCANSVFYIEIDNKWDSCAKIAISILVVLSSVFIIVEVNYLHTVISVQGEEMQRYFDVFNIISIAASICFTGFTLTGHFIEIDNGICHMLLGFKLYNIYIIGVCIGILLCAVYSKRKVGIKECIVLTPLSVFLLMALVVQLGVPGFNFYTSACAVGLVIEYIMFQSTQYDEKYASTEELFNGMASVYTAMYILDLKNRTYKEYSSIPEVHDYLEAHEEIDIQEKMWGSLRIRICEAHKEKVIEFADLATLSERMKDVHKLEIEAMNVDQIWNRYSFIKVNDELTKVIFSVRDIDKIRRKERELVLRTETDALTQIYNRYAYEKEIESIEQRGIGDDLWYINFDLNGLKTANDTRGHIAGDELIIAMAQSMSKVVAPYGKAYRIGGDEFVAIFRATREQTESMLEELEHIRSDWNGKYSSGFSFSKGVVCSAEFLDCTISMLEKEADRRMYDEKKAYYEKSGRDRRVDGNKK